MAASSSSQDKFAQMHCKAHVLAYYARCHSTYWGTTLVGFGHKQPRYLCGRKLPTQLPFGLHQGVTCHTLHHNLATAQHVACENESWNRWVGRQGSPASREPVKLPKRTNTQHSENKHLAKKTYVSGICPAYKRVTRNTPAA